jgi:hypothetical protein
VKNGIPVNSGMLVDRRDPFFDELFERIILGSIIETPALLSQDSLVKLKPGDFFLSSHVTIFGHLRQMHYEDEPIDAITLWNRIDAHGHAERVGGIEYVGQLVTGLVLRPNVDFYARKVQAYAKRRAFTKAAMQLAELAGDAATQPEELQAQVDILAAQYRDEARAERKLVFRTGAEVAVGPAEETDWIAKPYVAVGAVTELDGKPKLSGKTTFATHLAAAAVSGVPFLGEPTSRTGVVYLTEQSEATFRAAMRRSGLIGQEQFVFLCHRDTLGWTWPEVAQAAVEKCKGLGVRLLVVDTVGQFAGLTGDSENNAGDALAAMAPLQRAAGEGLAVVAIRHERKSGGEVGDSGRGSSAFVGAADVVISLRRPGGNCRPSLRELQGVSV